MKSLLVFIVFVLSSALAFPQDPDLGVEEQAQDIAQGVQAGEVPPQEEGSFVIDKEGPLPSPDNPFNVYLEENAAASGENFSEASIAKSILGFAVNFHKYLVTGDSGQQSTCGEPTVSGNPVENVVFSPLSLSNALSVLWRGSSNDTEKQLRDVLLFPEVEQRDKTFQESYGKLLNAVVAEDRGVTLDFASTIFGNLGTTVFTRFFRAAEKYFNTLLRAVSFRDDPERAKNQINTFVSRTTRGKIPELLKSAPDSQTLLMLVNAVYFNGNWKMPFDEQDTHSRPFYISEDETVEVPSLFNVMELPYYENAELGFQLVGLPYDGEQFTFYIILPKAQYVTGLMELEQKLTPQIIADAVNGAEPFDWSFSMPKLDLEERIDLKPVLEGLGICSLFNNNAALSRVAQSDLFISEAVHQAKLIVNEKGTEAAAATFFTATRSSQSINVNKPFIFIIMDNVNKVPIFQGRIVRP